MKVFVVTIKEFDSMENRDPEYIAVRSYFSTKAKAKLFIKKYSKNNKPYKGYFTDDIYPQYLIEEKIIK